MGINICKTRNFQARPLHPVQRFEQGECWSVRYFYDTAIEILNLYFFASKLKK